MTHKLVFLCACLMASASAQATTLDEAIAAALVHTPAIAMAEAAHDAADGRVRQALGAALPTATISGSIGAGRLDPQNFFGLGAANVTPRMAQAAIEQPLFAGGRIVAGIDQARAGRAMAAATRTATRADVMTAVAAAYGDVLTTAHVMALTQRMTEEMVEIERQARLRFKAGEVPSTDVAQATARLAEARAALARAEGQRASAVAHYRNLVGQAPSDLAPLPAPPAIPASLDEAVTMAAGNSPAIARAEAGVTAARAARRAAKADLMPTIGAFAEATAVRDQFFPDYRSDAATIGVRARWELFSGGRTMGRIAETGAEARVAEEGLRAARMGVEEQVISAFEGVRAATLVEQAAADQDKAAAAARDSVRHEVRVGMKPQLALLDAEREALAAAMAAAQARADRVVAAYRLNGLLGSR